MPVSLLITLRSAFWPALVPVLSGAVTEAFDAVLAAKLLGTVLLDNDFTMLLKGVLQHLPVNKPVAKEPSPAIADKGEPVAVLVVLIGICAPLNKLASVPNNCKGKSCLFCAMVLCWQPKVAKALTQANPRPCVWPAKFI